LALSALCFERRACRGRDPNYGQLYSVRWMKGHRTGCASRPPHPKVAKGTRLGWGPPTIFGYLGTYSVEHSRFRGAREVADIIQST
jgi:hypothetical protein